MSNRYFIELQRPDETEWRFVSECAESMVLPEMVMQALDVLKLTEAGAVRLRCQQARAVISSPDTIHLTEARHYKGEHERWTKKLERYRASQAVESEAGA